MRIQRQDDNFRNGEKWCAHGQHWVVLDKFAKHKSRKQGLSDYCKACMRERWHSRKLYNRDKRYQKLYGITLDEYNALCELQEFRCAICKTKECGGHSRHLHVDHCHKTNKVRGLLCDKCNHGIGFFDDSIEKLKKALEYLS